MPSLLHAIGVELGPKAEQRAKIVPKFFFVKSIEMSSRVFMEMVATHRFKITAYINLSF